MSTREQNSTFRHSPSRSGEAVTTKSHKLITSPRTKLDRARPRVMLLTACLVYLTTTLFAFQISVASVLNLISPEYERFNDQLLAHSSALRKEQIVYGRLDNVLSTELNRGFMETYEDCLVRGLERANHELIGLGFRYPDIREQVMEWTIENCGRLQYAPQVVNEEPTPQEAVLTYWAILSYRARRVAGETLSLVKRKLGWIFCRLLSSGQREDASRRVDDTDTDEDMGTNDSVSSERVLPQIPFGFALQCQPDQPCRLFYPAGSTTDSQELHVSPETLKKLEQRTAELFTFNTTLDQMRSIISQASRTAVYLEIFFLCLSIITFIYSLIIKTDPSYPHPGTEATYLIKSMMIEHLSAAAAFTLDRYPGIFPNIRSALVFAFIITTLGLSMVLKFLISRSQLETIPNILQSLQELYLILRNREIPGEECTSEIGEGNTGTEDRIPNPESTSQKKEKTIASSIPRAPLKSHHRFADPTTTVQEDIRRSRELLRQERTKQQTASDDSVGDAGFDTDTESESDAFVHIAIDAAHQVSISDEPTW